MKFRPLALDGAWRIELEPRFDKRGWFARTFCADELVAHGIDPTVAQENVSVNPTRGTLRGLHLQTGDAAEGKHVMCSAGAAYDVLVDVRPESPTFRHWVAVELSAKNRITLYAPAGIAHGFLTLVDDTEIAYRMTHRYVPEASSGHRWNDPAFAIEWPFDPVLIAERDATWPDFPE